MNDDERMHFRVERAPFVMVPCWLLFSEVSDGAVRTYCNLHDLVAGREGPTRPLTRGELAAKRGVSPNTIDRHLAELIAMGAVEKEACIPSGGQVGNVYRVWVTHPRQRPPVGSHEVVPDRVPKNGDPPRDPVDNRVPTNGEPPQRWGPALPESGDPTAFKEGTQEIPPQPPRTAGGLNAPQPNGNGTTRRAVGTNPRSLKVNPRAEDEALAAARERERVAAAAAAAERKEADRRAAEEAAEAAARAGEAERLALAATLGDIELAAVVERVTTGLAGPLAQSPLAVSRSVVLWCRTAAERCPGPLAAAVAVGLADGLDRQSVEDVATPPPLDLPPAPPDTVRLPDRIRTLRDALDPSSRQPRPSDGEPIPGLSLAPNSRRRYHGCR